MPPSLSRLLAAGGSEAHGETDELVGTVEFELGLNTRAMGLDGFRTDLQFVGDFLVVFRLANVVDNQEFTVGETFDMRSFIDLRGMLVHAIEDSRANAIAYMEMPFGHGLESFDEGLFGGGFHKVSIGAGFEAAFGE